MTGTDRPDAGVRRDFWLLWSTSTASNLGDGIRLTALPLLAVAITTDPLAIGAVTAASFAPWLLFALVGGAVADRVDRRRLILVGQVARAAAVGGFAALVAADRAGLAAVYAIALVIGVGEVVVDSALQAAVPHVAGGDLERANSRLSSAQLLANDVIGGPLGGVLFTVAPAIPFAVDAGSFALGVVLVGVMVTPLQAPAEPVEAAGAAGGGRVGGSSMRADIAEGVRFLLAHRLLAGLAGAVALSNLADAAVKGLLVLLVVDRLGAADAVFGLVLAAGAVGGFVGAANAGRLTGAAGRRPVLVGSFLALGAGNAVIASAPRPELVAAGSFVAMFAVGSFNVTNSSIRQRVTPDRLLGRVVASSRLPAFGAVPIGGLGGGALARVIGLRPTLGVAAAVSLAIAALVARVTAGHDLEHLETFPGPA